MASPGNRHCVNCIGALSFPIYTIVIIYTVYMHRVQKKSDSLLFIYFSQFWDKFYETFSEYAYVNMSTEGNLILTESVNILCAVT